MVLFLNHRMLFPIFCCSSNAAKYFLCKFYMCLLVPASPRGFVSHATHSKLGTAERNGARLAGLDSSRSTLELSHTGEAWTPRKLARKTEGIDFGRTMEGPTGGLICLSCEGRDTRSKCACTPGALCSETCRRRCVRSCQHGSDAEQPCGGSPPPWLPSILMASTSWSWSPSPRSGAN